MVRTDTKLSSPPKYAAFYSCSRFSHLCVFLLMTKAEKEAGNWQYSIDKLGPNAEEPLLWLSTTMRGAYLQVLSNRNLVQKYNERSCPLRRLNPFAPKTPVKLVGLDRELFLSYLHLDTMAKTVNIVENFLALCHVLAFHRNAVVEKLVHVPNTMSEVIPELDEAINGSQRGETTKQILSLPEMNNIGEINDEERALLSKLTDASIRKFARDYTEARSFFECHRGPYNKLRHGMSVILNMQTNLDKASFAIDTVKGSSRQPPNLVTINARFPWGNTLAIVPTNESNMAQYEIYARETDFYTRFLIGSLFSYIMNCGEGYLPGYMRTENTLVLSYIPDYQMPPSEKRVFDRICEKTLPNYVWPHLKVRARFGFGPKYLPQVESNILTHRSATVRFTGHGNEATYERGRTPA